MPHPMDQYAHAAQILFLKWWSMKLLKKKKTKKFEWALWLYTVLKPEALTASHKPISVKEMKIFWMTENRTQEVYTYPYSMVLQVVCADILRVA